ncbi:hypothetical protein EII29_06750 [Leptotrichia sp. OH3620_COT-345]|uniref:VOC family protein n=1 Tax=Leptotrichia sp. OH3620_COT-345 TaxID=2491048 RepID=UPI000F652366|nr:VOC family protein [Leptotrichia sp. OH3620_COT-345]RRD39503.1 hypothetical protein EII29_06750 [Leptotrichia sp. OH3620_COT-345]
MNRKNENEYGFNFETVVLRVKNIKKMKDFYLKLLKMDILKENREKEKETVVLGVNKREIIKLVSYGNENIKENNEINVYHVAYLLPSRKDLGNFLKNCIKENIKIDGTGDHSVSEAIYLTDPEANGIEVYADRDSNTWKWDRNYVIMGTTAVNIKELLEISQEISEFKIPENTKIGHIHMETSDLEKEKNFYMEKFGMEIVSCIPGAYFVSINKYHHHFGINRWNSKRKIIKKENSTGIEEIYISVNREIYDKVFLESGKFEIKTPNGIKLIIHLNEK